MLVFFALALAVLLGFCGLAVDVGLLQLKQLQLQNAADAAVQGAIHGSNQAGMADAALNGFTNGVNGVSVSIGLPGPGSSYAGNSAAVQAIVSQSVQPIFSRSKITVSASATGLASANGCMFLLSTISNQPSILLANGSLSGNCSYYLGLSYNLNSGSKSTGAEFMIAGPSSASSSSTAIPSPAPIFGSTKQNDPLGYINQPSFSGCDKSSNSLSLANTTVTLYPGTYCGGWQFSNLTATLSPGTYILTGASTVGTSTLKGNGVTLALSQGGGYGYGTLDIGNSTLTLTAPNSGSLQGVLVSADRSWNTGDRGLNLTNSPCTCTGIFYLPYLKVNDSQSPISGGAYFGIVADSLEIDNASAAITSDYSSLTGGNPFRSSASALVE